MSVRSFQKYIYRQFFQDSLNIFCPVNFYSGKIINLSFFEIFAIVTTFVVFLIFYSL
jgi:hypothetical protein